MRQNRGLGIRDLVRLNHDMDLTTGLHGIGALDAVMRISDLLELLKALDVILGGLATGARTGCRNGIAGLNENCKNGIRVDVAVMGLDSMDDNGLLAVTTGKIGADDGMGTLDIMVDGLSEVMKQTGTLGGHDVDTKLGGHDSAQLGNLERMLQDVLPEGGTIAQSAQGSDDLRMQVMDPRIEGGLFARFANALVNEIGGLVVHLLDARRMDTAICDEVLQRNASGLATNRIEAGQHDRLGRIVDDEIDAGNLLERTDIAAFASDDATFEVIRGNMDRSDGDLSGMVGGATLDGEEMIS